MNKKSFIVTIYSTVEELTYEKCARMILEGLHGHTFGMSIEEPDDERSDANPPNSSNTAWLQKRIKKNV